MSSTRPVSHTTRFSTRSSLVLTSLLILGALAGAGLASAEMAEARTFGDGAGSGALVPIAEILADPDAFAGESVRVSGEITGVCPKKGCWMELRDGDASLRVKVEDDVIVFPADAEGQRAVAQGRIEVREMSREDYEGWMRHLAEEQGESFDAASIGDGPYRLVQLRGTGAEISENG